jgi:hypothetical protein
MTVSKEEYYAADIRNYKRALERQPIDEETRAESLRIFIENLPPVPSDDSE